MNNIVLTIEIRVLDDDLLKKFCVDRLKQCWDMSEEQIAEEYPHLHQLALEGVALSNMNPSPDELGFEFVTYTSEEVPDGM